LHSDLGIVAVVAGAKAKYQQTQEAYDAVLGETKSSWSEMALQAEIELHEAALAYAHALTLKSSIKLGKAHHKLAEVQSEKSA
jgi:hypothetical protein